MKREDGVGRPAGRRPSGPARGGDGQLALHRARAVDEDDAGRSAGGHRARAAGVAGTWSGLAQPPRPARHELGDVEAVEVAGDDERWRPCGPTCVRWKSTMSSRVIAVIDRGRAGGRAARPARSAPTAWRVTSRAARCGAEARSCSISASRLRRMRRTSASGKTGSDSACRSRSRAAGRNRCGTSTSTLSAPSVTEAPSAMPVRSISSANSSLECVGGALVEQPGRHRRDALPLRAARR